MKFSTLLALTAAPLAMAKAVHNTYGKRTPMMMRREEAASPLGMLAERKKDDNEKGQGAADAASLQAAALSGQAAAADPVLVAELQALGLSGLGITSGATTNVILIWVNPGAGAPTTTVNAAPAATAAPAAPPAAAATHEVIVGGTAGLIYSPSEVKAAVGDMVVFTFMSANHTVTQSTFEEPCSAMAGGMDSGFQANPNNTVTPPPQVAMQVMVDTPLWFYCKQKGHCGKGMTFSINPSAAKTQAMFQALAIAQNGTGAGTAITGGNGTAAAPPAAAAPAAIGSAAGAGGAATMGSGQVEGGACVCAVTCSTGSFPAAVQGVSSFGGMAGSLPRAMSEPMMNGF